MKKICKKCKLEKSMEEFQKNKAYKDGRKPVCKKCWNKPREQLPPGVKRCTQCKIIKPYMDFSRHSRMGDGYRSGCKVCTRERLDREKNKAYMKQYHIDNREKDLVSRKARRDQINNTINALKNKPCVDCGVKYHFCQMDFDHISGEKIGDVGTLKSYSLQVVLAEIEKCELVCANCHRLRTYKRIYTNLSPSFP